MAAPERSTPDAEPSPADPPPELPEPSWLAHLCSTIFCCDERPKCGPIIASDCTGLAWAEGEEDDAAAPGAALRAQGLVLERPRSGMVIGVPAEIGPGETRIALDPTGARELVAAGFAVRVEAGAGERAGFADADYTAAGAAVGGGPAEVFGADVVLKVRPPGPNAALGCHEADLLQQGRGVLVCALTPERDEALLRRLEEQRITAFALNRAPRGSACDVAAATARLAGYYAALEAAERARRPFSAVPPLRLLVIGGGPAAGTAARTARALGAAVRLCAWRCENGVQEEAMALGCEVVALPAPGAGGGPEHLRAAVAAQCAGSEVVISAAGDGSMPIITESALLAMPAGSVVIDIASGAGGDAVAAPSGCSVTVVSFHDLISRRPREATEVWSRCAVAFLLQLVSPDDCSAFAIDLSSPLSRACAAQLYHEGGVMRSRRRRPRRWLRRRRVPPLVAGNGGPQEEDITWWDVVRLAEPEWPLISAGCLLTVLKVPFSLAVPHFAGAATGALFHKKRAVAIFSIKSLIVCGVVEMAIGTVGSLVFVSAQQKVIRRVRCELFDNLIRQDAAFYDTVPSGALASRLEVDTAEMASDLTWIFSTVLDSVCRVTGIGVYMMVYSSQLGAICFAAIPITAGLTAFFTEMIRESKMRVQGHLAAANDVSAEVFSQARNVHGAGTTEFEGARYRREAGNVYHSTMYQVAVGTGYTTSTDFVFLVSHAMILLAGVELVLHGQMEPSALIVFTSYQSQFRGSVLQLADVVSSFARATGAGAKVWRLMRRNPAPCATVLDGAVCPIAPTGTLTFTDVDFAYPSRPDAPVLRGISFAAVPGGTTAIVGRSGSGKSTLFSLLKRRYDISGGRIEMAGVDLAAVHPAWVQRRVAVVDQEPLLLSGTVAHNILYPALGEYPDLEERMERDPVLRDEWQSRIAKAAAAAGATDFISQLPDGFATEVGERGAALSGGQKQRVAIARALLLDPCVLLMDEATSALDPDAERAVTEALSQNAQGRTVLVIAQRLNTVRHADRIVVIDRGTVVEQGTHEELESRKPAQEGFNYRKLLDARIL